MLISPASKPQGHQQNKERFLLGLLTTHLPHPEWKTGKTESLSGFLHKIKLFILYG